MSVPKTPWEVQIPDLHNLSGGWATVGWFETPEAALEYARKTFGADENGYINVVVGPEDEEPELEQERCPTCGMTFDSPDHTHETALPEGGPAKGDEPDGQAERDPDELG